METKIVDAKGLACPLPVVNAKEAADSMTAGGTLTVLVDNEVAVQNLTRFASKRGYEVKSNKKGDYEFEVIMNVTACGNANISASEEEEEINCIVDSRKMGLVVSLGSNTMGRGEEKLGKTLMKAFIFALTKQEVLPETILCFNSGAYLSIEGSDSLEDLKQLEANGVKIYTCGTCLDYYGIKDKLAVGAVTNMYDIVETLESAKQIVNP